MKCSKELRNEFMDLWFAHSCVLVEPFPLLRGALAILEEGNFYLPGQKEAAEQVVRRELPKERAWKEARRATEIRLREVQKLLALSDNYDLLMSIERGVL